MKRGLFLFNGICVFLISVFIGCSSPGKQNGGDPLRNQDVSLKTGTDTSFVRLKTVADTSFLELEGDFNENPDLLWANQEIYLKALNRLESRIRIENNQFVWDFKSAEEMHMSEDLYNYIISIWLHYNERLLSGKEEIYIHKGGHYGLRWKNKKEIKKL